jgi:membrane-associated phospholipid phosphatase
MSDFETNPDGDPGTSGTSDTFGTAGTSTQASPSPAPAPAPAEQARVEVVTEQPQSIDETLKDPLLRAPRRSSVVLCIVFGIIFLALAGATWWIFVRTATGQQYDDLVWETLKDSFPSALMPIVYFFSRNTYVIAVIIVIGIVSVLMVVLRRRWLLLIQLVAFALASFLLGFVSKRVLPRPTLDPSLANPANSSPSGHSVAAFTAAVVLVLAVPLSARAIASVISFFFATSVGLSVVVEKWHRPSDVLVAFLMVTGLALLTLAFTRASGMDKAGARRSSVSVQILSTVMMVAGFCSLAFGAYLIWQVVPGLEQEAAWTLSASQGAASLDIAGVAGIGIGLILALRQITASPLSAIGLVGAPPAPPSAPHSSTMPL